LKRVFIYFVCVRRNGGVFVALIQRLMVC